MALFPGAAVAQIESTGDRADLSVALKLALASHTTSTDLTGGGVGRGSVGRGKDAQQPECSGSGRCSHGELGTAHRLGHCIARVYRPDWLGPTGLSGSLSRVYKCVPHGGVRRVIWAQGAL